MAKTKPTVKQVEAWLYMVLGPVIHGLTQEAYFLTVQRAPTWRFRSRTCEYIHEVAHYIDASQLPTLNQFLRFNAKQAKLVHAHDKVLSDFQASASKAHDALVQLPAFQPIVEKVEREFPDWRGAYRVEDGPSLLAEAALNWAHLPEPPSHSTDAAAWKQYGPDVLRLRDDTSVAESFQTVEANLAHLAKTSTTLKDSLVSLRDELADKYGLPPAPPTSSEVLRLETRERF